MHEDSMAQEPDMAGEAATEGHLRKLMEELPLFLDNKEARRLHRAATIANQRNEEALDLESFINGRVTQLRHRGYSESRIDEDPFVKVKRLQLARERGRVKAALRDGGFTDIDEARAQILPPQRYNELTREYNRFRADYAQTLAAVSESEAHRHC